MLAFGLSTAPYDEGDNKGSARNLANNRNWVVGGSMFPMTDQLKLPPSVRRISQDRHRHPGDHRYGPKDRAGRGGLTPDPVPVLGREPFLDYVKLSKGAFRVTGAGNHLQ